MNDRDRFAAAAITGLIVADEFSTPKSLAEDAYAYADALLEQRALSGEPVAWLVRPRSDEPPLLFVDEALAKDLACFAGVVAVPLYRRE